VEGFEPEDLPILLKIKGLQKKPEYEALMQVMGHYEQTKYLDNIDEVGIDWLIPMLITNQNLFTV